MISAIGIRNIGVFCSERSLPLEMVGVEDVWIWETFVVLMDTPNIQEEYAAFGQDVPVDHFICSQTLLVEAQSVVVSRLP